MGVVWQVLEGENVHARNANPVAKLDPLRRSSLGCLLGNHGIQDIDKLCAIGERAETCVFLEFIATRENIKILPIFIRVRKYTGEAILGSKRLSLFVQQSPKAGLAERWIEGEPAKAFDEIELDGRFKHGDFYRLAPTTARAIKERGQNRIGNRLSGELVTNGCRYIRRLTLNLGTQCGNTGGRLYQIIVRRLVSVWPGGSKAKGAAINNVR